MSRGVKALFAILLGLPLALMSCGALGHSEPAPVVPSEAQVRAISRAAVETASSYHTRTPTIREQELQATESALRAGATPTPLPDTLAGIGAPLPTAELVPLATLLPTPTPPPLDPRVSQQLNDYLNGQFAAGVFSGSVLVAKNGRIVFAQGYGMADVENGVPNTPSTRFRLGSLTKQFTAVAILMLQADGALNVNDPICRYLADCPAAWQAITIRHLLTHTSGIPNYTDFADFELTEMLPATPEQLIGRFRDLPLNFLPGNAYSYCNSGYVLLGAIVERAAGQPYEQFLQQRIFTPLGMSNTGYDHDTLGTSGRAIGYVVPARRADPLDLTTLYAAGALYSTVEDLFLWDQALYADELLPTPLMGEMFTAVRNAYGYGWKVMQLHNRRSVSHDGLVSGFSTSLLRFPDDQTTVIVLSNLQSSPAGGIAIDLAGILFSQ